MTERDERRIYNKLENFKILCFLRMMMMATTTTTTTTIKDRSHSPQSITRKSTIGSKTKTLLLLPSSSSSSSLRRRRRGRNTATTKASDRTHLTNLTDSGEIKKKAQLAISSCITETKNLESLKEFTRYEGKVRDTYVFKDVLVAVTTDRQSAFDRHLANIPFKGAVLNMTSFWWFEKTKEICENAVLVSPPVHPNVSIMRKCDVFPIEFVVRGYLTGSTSTSLWTHYKTGGRNYCGNFLEDDMVKNQKLTKNIVTPTTKEKEHDRPISIADIVSENWMNEEDLNYCVEKTLEIFEFSQKIASERNLILVDTKYEFGKCPKTGKIFLIDEINTPDSSRYWIQNSYEERFAKNEEPDMIDKEFLRLWFASRCDPYNTSEKLPEAPTELKIELSAKYALLYEMITGETFEIPLLQSNKDANKIVDEKIKQALIDLKIDYK